MLIGVTALFVTSGCAMGSRAGDETDGGGSDDDAASTADGNTTYSDGTVDGQSSSCGPDFCPAGCCNTANACLPGTEDTACGTDGQSCQDCTAAGEICSGQQCVTGESCSPGEVDDTGGDCGTRCGHQERTCDANGQWGAWECVDEGECDPGTVDDSGGSCGDRCGHEERTCSSTCTWGSWECVDEGDCVPGTKDIGSSCGTYHQNERTCASDCTYGSFTCVCTVDGHGGTGDNGDPCSQQGAWRCVYSNIWSTNISQVCYSGTWQTCEIDPPDCNACCGGENISTCGDCT